VSQASFDPPLLMVAVREGSQLLAAVMEAGAFAINLPGIDQQNLVAAFFKPNNTTANQLGGQPFRPGPATGAPILTAVPAWLEARVLETVDRGDHTILVTEIVDAGIADPEIQPLALRDTPWKYAH
ncbi:MAG: flavin reductase family protein, partial [Candidatus Neomarinimicrobiota bacterium]